MLCDGNSGGQWVWYGGAIKLGWGSLRDGNEGWAEFEVWCGWCVFGLGSTF